MKSYPISKPKHMTHTQTHPISTTITIKIKEKKT